MKLQVRHPMLIALLIVSTSALQVDVKTDYDHKVNFSQYKTYSWLKVETPNSLWDKRVKEAVDEVLAEKGWTQVPADGDVSIVAIGTTQEKPTLRTFYDGFDGWYWNGFLTATTTVENYTVGTLVLDMFDTKTKRLIWRGSASDVLSGKPEKDEGKLKKAVQKMFEHFPPKPKEA